MEFYEKKPLWQSVNWKNFQESLGFESFFVGKNNEEILVILKKLPLGKAFLDIQRGNLTADLWKEIQKIAQQKRAIFCRISLSSNALPEFLKEKAFVTGAHRFPELTSIVDLSKTEEEILAAMSQSGRRHIRIAQKENVEIIESKDVSIFAKLLNETTARQGFSGHNSNYYQKLLDCFGDNAFMLLAKKEDKILAGGIFVYSSEFCTYYYGASTEELREVQAPTLLQWAAILKAKKAGKKYFDFLGIAPKNALNHPWLGVSLFKRKFGGIEIGYTPEIEIPFSNLYYRLFKISAFLRRLIK